MPGPEQLIRAAVALPFSIARRMLGVVGGLLSDDSDDRPPAAPPPTDDLGAAIAADDALTRARNPVEEAPLLADDDLSGHVEPEVELVGESADTEATESPGPEIRVEER